MSKPIFARLLFVRTMLCATEYAIGQMTWSAFSTGQYCNLFKEAGCGHEDIAFANCTIMLSKLDEAGVQYGYSEYPGGHTWPVWKNNLYNFAQVLIK